LTLELTKKLLKKRLVSDKCESKRMGKDSQEENPYHPYLLTLEKSIYFVMKCVK
jgi:hypothetical protein